ncbi:LEAF RUST 10 DISEASE-RESISTANCE LOCUS RECEPTOR-LIKE PROTEIN KINASE-like 2.4 isoform X2 [Cryptomeria japonica]|uniref:LEAF RUST 10 DISEASE-RESISTANCE LOCUS RECEPTOR-LIKE PROTEIN KINASE-like 2.4 isoform X2 n=1 Tax=Cryptomeria japonica TaxID=3369 RepID=UPI0025AD3A63|nr:LEAF RUST 10 DISEASE-RESISTANCE LOCUS RECEPTOR-LIKE PROTEIN KINASE-like 2.4 isoform X2 [Cryptomeria japonica]
MDALPGLPLTLHLSCSLPSSSINGRPLRFLWLLFTILISWLSSHCDGACQKPFTCGFYSLAYPFGGRNSGCGDPALQLDCDSYLGMPLINISGHQYYIRLPTVFSAENSSQSMTIIDNNLWGSSCDPSSSNNTAQFWSSPQFHIANDYKNITLGEQCEQEILPSNASKLECSDDWYYIPTSNLSLATPAYCKSYVQLPVNIDPKLPRSMSLTEIVQQGFEIEWNFSRGCENCVSRNGTCNYNTRTMKPFCQMEDAILNLSNSGSKFKSISFVFILGILGSALLIVALLLAIAHRKNNSTFGRQVLRGKRGNSRSISQVETFLHNFVHQMPTRYSYSNIKEITNNFAHKLGKGGFGEVYRGSLASGSLVAVKMLDQSRESETQFMNEVTTLGRIHHIHLVRLLGYCFEGLTSALVYEYMANGSLDRFILANKGKGQILSWDQLYSIALGSARGIAYLHNECRSRIIHFDIKPHNILLDEEFTAKVADFGLAKLCGRTDDHVSMTTARGTPGYVAPELWSRNSGPVTDKSDVYGFGMMILEMVGGRKNVDLQVSRSSQFYFPDWAIKLVERGELRTRLREIELSDAEEVKARSLVKVGLWCIQHISIARPSMMRVLQMLEGDVDDIPNPPTPFDSRPRPAPFSSSEESSSIGIETAS